MPISLFIDNNAWDEFFDRKLDLAEELPISEFSLQITREAEFEILLMPTEKRLYVEAAMKARNIITDEYFGFYNETLSPEEQRYCGFAEENNPGSGGRFASEEELSLIRKEIYSIGTTKRPTGLYKNEADVSLAARSLISVVLTCDGKKSLKRAKKIYGGLVIDLKKYSPGENLANFIKSELSNFEQKNSLVEYPYTFINP